MDRLGQNGRQGRSRTERREEEPVRAEQAANEQLILLYAD